jgi:hypothetical protein
MVANFMKIRAGKVERLTCMNGIIAIRDSAVKICDTFKAKCSLRHGFTLVQKPRHAPYICAVPLVQSLEHGFEIRLSEKKILF